MSVSNPEFRYLCILTIVITCDIPVFEIPRSWTTDGNMKVIPNAPIPCNIHMRVKGMKLGV